MRLLAALLAACLSSPASAAANKAVVTAPVVPVAAALPSVPALPAGALPSAFPTLPAAGADLRLDPSVQAAMANPVPATAAGLKAGYFQPVPAGPAAAAAGGVQVPQGALSSTQRVADAAGPAAVPGAAESASSSLFDGYLSRPGAVAVTAAAPPYGGSGAGRRSAPAAKARAASAQPQQGQSGQALLESLHASTGRGFRAHDYGQAQDFLFSIADQTTVGGKAGLIDAYSGIFKEGRGTEGGDYPERGDENGDGHVDNGGMNVEHIWPQSFFDKRLPMKSDLHHLMATFIFPNGIRGHLPFGEVRGAGDYSNSAGAKRGQGVFEPPNFSKGRVARSLLYFYVRYYDRNITNGAFGEDFWNTKLEMLLRWNRQFPPTQWEVERNDRVEKFQGNRNPFVDDHTLADRIGLDALRRVPRVQFHERARIQRRRGR